MKSFIIGICGGSASGKTTLANELVEALGKEHTNFLSLDDYYIDFIRKGFDPAEVNYDHPESIEIEKLAKDLRNLGQGYPTKIPVYDFITHTRSNIPRLLKYRQYIILEGLFLFNLAALTSLINLKIFIDTPDDIRLKRRMERDTRERNRSLKSVKKQYDQFVYPMYLKFVKPNQELADFVLLGNHAFKDQIPDVVKLIKLNTDFG